MSRTAKSEAVQGILDSIKNAKSSIDTTLDNLSGIVKTQLDKIEADSIELGKMKKAIEPFIGRTTAEIATGIEAAAAVAATGNKRRKKGPPANDGTAIPAQETEEPETSEPDENSGSGQPLENESQTDIPE